MTLQSSSTKICTSLEKEAKEASLSSKIASIKEIETCGTDPAQSEKEEKWIEEVEKKEQAKREEINSQEDLIVCKLRLFEMIVEDMQVQMSAENAHESKISLVFRNGNKYSGEWKHNQMHGRGIFEWADGSIYEGDFFENQINGTGIYRWTDGSFY
eukprot:Sdes_comp13356_c0_seq1m3155